MKKLRSLPTAKVVAVLLLTACVIGVPCLGYLLIDSANQCYNIRQVSDFWNYHYSESTEFSNDVNLRLQQLTEYLKLKKILETDGELDYNKTAAEVYTVNGREEYTVGELLKYNQSNYGFYSEEVMPVSRFSKESFVKMKRAVYSITKKRNGDAQVEEVESAEFVTDFTKNENPVFFDLEVACKYYQAWWEMEKSPENMNPSSEENRNEIAEFLDSISDKLGKENTGAAQSVIGGVSPEEGKVSLLSDAAYCMAYYVAYYQYYQSIFEDTAESGFSDPDFLYWISVPNQKVYTNVKENDLGENPKEEFSNHSMLGEIWYQTENYMMKATMQIDRTKIAELEDLFLKEGEEQISIHIAIPMEARDGLFATQKESLEKLYLSIPMYAGFLILTGIAALLCICFLFYAAGHKAGYEGIYLNWFDRWYTEIAAGICAFLGVFSLLIGWDKLDRAIYLYYGYSVYEYEAIIIGCTFSFATYVFALFSFASLTRRIKARTLWKRSLTYRIFKYIMRRIGLIRIAVIEIWEKRSVSKKVILGYIGVIMVNIIMSVVLVFLLGYANYDGMALIFCLCLLAVIFAVNFRILRGLIKRELELYEVYNGAERISSGDWNYKLDEMIFHGMMRRMAVIVNRIGDGLSSAIEQSIRDERMKTDLITNVSHDIKTPLTSIINYVDLLKREQFEDEKVQSYLSVLDQKSQRLKNLIDDLIEASKLSSKTVVLSIEKIDLVELVRQTNGEFAEKFAVKNLTIIPALPEKPVYIKADGKGMWRVLENLYINVSKYAMENTRVYISVSDLTERVEFSIKNISANPLNINASELTERFIRGDLSRSTEGSGLGLSIAKSLTELMHGTFEIYLDGDLFRVTIVFEAKEETALQNVKKEIIIEEMKNENEE